MLFLVSTAIAWLILYFFDLRKTGPEVFGDKIWWNNIRPIHAIFYLLASYFIYNNKKNTSIKFLLADVSFGFIAYIIHNFYK